MTRPWRYLNWTHREKRLFWKAIYWLCRAKITTKRQNFEDLKNLLGREASDKQSLFAEPNLAKPALVAVRRAKQCLPFHCQCLVEAIAVQTLCRQLNLPSTLHLGVNKKGEQRQAHAWVSLGDEIIAGKNDDQFTDVQRFS